MSERRAAAPPAGESIAALSEHLGRMLQHADRLVAEWQEHADAMRARFEAEARDAGNVLRKAIEEAMAEAGGGAAPKKLAQQVTRARDAAERLGGPAMLGAPPDVQDQLGRLARDLTSLRQELSRATAPREPGRERLLVPLALAANVLLIAILALVWLRKPPAPTAAPAGPDGERPVASTILADAGAGQAPTPSVDPPEVRVANPCAAIALSGGDAERSLAECLDHICGMPDKDKPSLPDNCRVERETPKKGKKKVILSCTFGAAPAQRTLRVEWPGECPAPPPAAPAPASDKAPATP